MLKKTRCYLKYKEKRNRGRRLKTALSSLSTLAFDTPLRQGVHEKIFPQKTLGVPDFPPPSTLKGSIPNGK